MKLLKQFSIHIAVLALCFLCAPTLSFAQGPMGDPTDERPRPRANMSGRPGDASDLGKAIRINAKPDYIEYDLPTMALVEIWLYDEKGTMRQSLRNDWQMIGNYGLTVKNDSLPAGTYFYDIIINGVLFRHEFRKD